MEFGTSLLPLSEWDTPVTMSHLSQDGRSGYLAHQKSSCMKVVFVSNK